MADKYIQILNTDSGISLEQTVYEIPICNVIYTGNSFVDYIYYSDYYLDGQNQLTNKDILETIIPAGCYVTGIGTILKDQRTAGTIDFKITKNGTPITPTDLDIQINASYPLDRKVLVNFRTSGYDYDADDRLRVRITTSGFAPLENTGKIFVMIKHT